MSREARKYDASDIQVLEALEAVRKRPGMYIGSTGERGLSQLVFEVADRAVNEVLAGRARCVDITLLPDRAIRVADDGPGVPFEDAGVAGGPGLEALLTRMFPGVSPGDRRGPELALLGIGPMVANALSSRAVAEVRREGVRRVQEYARGAAVTTPADAGLTDETGTAVTFWPDPEIFGTAQCSFDRLTDRFRELAFLNRNLDVSLTDRRRPSETRMVQFRSSDGVRDLVAFLDEQETALTHPDIISFEQEDPQTAETTEVALRWHASSEERVRSFANSQATDLGGTHVAGFQNGVRAAVNAYARKLDLLTAAEADFGSSQISDGLTAVVSVKLEHPSWEGSTRGQLGNVEAHTRVRQAVLEHLGTWLEENPQQAAAIIDRIVQAGRLEIEDPSLPTARTAD